MTGLSGRFLHENDAAWLTAGWDVAPLPSRSRSGFPGGSDTPFFPMPPLLRLAVLQQLADFQQVCLWRDVQGHHPEPLDAFARRAEAMEDLQHALPATIADRRQMIGF